ncbi:hypothetical protein [Microvirga sp. 2TAF3]|uniref:hypothetical protein n=1 Tax=Microvirga sp. 2TAF3 TaxID=3233014 RepID=UPI003F9BD156
MPKLPKLTHCGHSNRSSSPSIMVVSTLRSLEQRRDTEHGRGLGQAMTGLVGDPEAAADPLTAAPADRSFTGHVSSADAAWVTGAWRRRLTLAGAVEAARRAVADTLERIRSSG